MVVPVVEAHVSCLSVGTRAGWSWITPPSPGTYLLTDAQPPSSAARHHTPARAALSCPLPVVANRRKPGVLPAEISLRLHELLRPPADITAITDQTEPCVTVRAVNRP